MPIETWFPLAVYFEDLPAAGKHQAEMEAAAMDWAGKKLREDVREAAAWTGDINGVERIHDDPRFAWITAEVARHCVHYLRHLGVDLSKIELHFQRSWPIVSQPGQEVAPHAHLNANVSAVYYVTVPDSQNSGSLVFHDMNRANELSPALTSSHTGGVTSYNPLNYTKARYAPQEGRLVLFPSKQRHSVTKNGSDRPRISLSFDIVITSRAEANPGLYEYLMPPPSQWKRFPNELLDSDAQ